MSYDIGEATLRIVPSFAGVTEYITAESAKWAKPAAQAFVDNWNRIVKGGLGLPNDTEFERKGTQSGGAFADSFKARVSAALHDLPSPDIKLDDAELDAQLTDIRARLKELGDAKVGVDISDTEAIAKLEALKLELDEIGARSPNVQVRVDVARASAELAAFQAQLASLDAEIAATDAEEIVPEVGAFATAFASVGASVGLIAAAVPVAAALTAALAGAATVLGSLAGGLGVIALAFSGVASAVKGELAPAFAQLQQTAAAGLLPGVQEAISALMPLFPALNAFVGQLARTIGSLAAEAAKALSSPFWHQFFDYVSATAGPTLVVFAHVVANLAKGFAGLLEAFAPVVQRIGAGLESLTARFAAFGANAAHNGFQSFLSYIESTGPRVVSMLLAVGEAFGHILAALAPIGAALLPLIQGFADIISHIPTPVLTTLFGAMVVGAGVVGGVAAAFAAMSVAETVVAATTTLLTAAMTALDVALDANPIGVLILAVAALGLAFYEAYKHIGPFRDAVNAVANLVAGAVSDAFRGLKVVVGSVVNFIADHWRELVPLLLGPLAPLGELATHFGLVKDAAVAAYHGIVDAFGEVFGFFKSLPGEILGFFKDAGKWLYDAGKSIIQGLIDGLESLLGKIGDVVSSILSKLNPLNDVQSLVGSVISHIPGFASGVQNFGGGLAVVGENGPELLDLPSGSSVYPNSVYESLTAPRPLVAAASVPAAGNGATVVYAQFGEETIEARSVRVAHGVVDSRVASAQEREARGVAGSPLKHLARV